MQIGVLHSLPLVIVLSACQSPPLPPGTHQEFVCSIGETQVCIRVDEYPGSDLVFINLHDDENTGVEAGLRLIQEKGGRLIQLEHDGNRLISFVSDANEFKFDPNRMFTDKGARRTLENEGEFSETAFHVVRQFADKVLSICRFNELGLIVTIHNNGNLGYSAESYTSGAIYETDALKVHLGPDADADDFFFVTELSTFNYLIDKGFGVVLQDNEKVTDDGSLSVLAGRRGIPYINVEAEEGHFQSQLKMLREVYALYGN